jgi:hypothetical protein
LDRDQAIRNMRNNWHRLAVAVPARFGRLLAVYRPSQTVGWVATWMTTGTGLIWAWVASFWLILVLAVVGGIRAWRSHAFMLPLLGPVIAMIGAVAVGYGEPRYHTLADLGIIVFAAVAITSWSTPPTSEARAAPPSPREEKAPTRLPSIYVPR